jgi:CRP-like cAMP-binding protein
MSGPLQPDADQAALLSQATLRPADGVRVVDIRADRVALKHLAGGTYLVVSRTQRDILDRFEGGRTAPQVLCELLSERLSPPLREYYELLLKAVRAGVLVAPGHTPPPPKPAAPWPWRLPGRLGRFFALTTMCVAMILVTTHTLEMPSQPWHLALGWVVVCLCVSVGQLAGASVVVAGDGEIYSPRWTYRSLLPGFRFDDSDSIMLGREGEIDLALVRIAPLFVATALAALRLPPLVLPLFAGLLYQLSPFSRTPLMALLRAAYRDPRLDTSYDLRFAQNQLFLILLRSRLKFADQRFLLMSAGYSVVWLTLVFVCGCALLHANAGDLVRLALKHGGARMTAVVLLVGMSTLVAGGAGLGLWFAVRHVRTAVGAWLAPRAARRRRPVVAPESILACLAGTHLFRTLPPSDLAVLATVVGTEEVKARANIVRQGEAGDRLYIVFSGAVEIVREPPVGRAEVVAELQAGEVFGEIALLRGGLRTRTVRASCPTVLLSIAKDDFAGLVLSHLSREAVETAVQKLSFLARIPLSRAWSPRAAASFAQRSQFKEFPEQEALIREGESNQFFHIVHEGEFAVRQGDVEIARLRAGDFFGEISLLQSSVATATIVAVTPARCLVMPRRDFLDFITYDFLIGLQFEEISSKRLGKPIFPLGRAAFAEAR